MYCNLISMLNKLFYYLLSFHTIKEILCFVKEQDFSIISYISFSIFIFSSMVATKIISSFIKRDLKSYKNKPTSVGKTLLSLQFESVTRRPPAQTKPLAYASTRRQSKAVVNMPPPDVITRHLCVCVCVQECAFVCV